jgi:tetratricopeptide (TPR) repeat protein
MLLYLLPILVLALLAAGGLWGYRRYFPRWQLVTIKGEFTVEHHLPDVLPVPKAEAARVANQDFQYDEAVEWMRQFVRSRRRHKLRPAFVLALKKVEFYRELSQKMGRGQWREVDEVAQRLAKLDPLDPSALLARGRAMRQLGKFAMAIRHYQQALQLQPFHSLALPEMAATCRMVGQPGRVRPALDRARRQLGETHPLTIESRIQLGELVRVYADPTDPATVAHVPREQYLETVEQRLEDLELTPHNVLQVGQQLLNDDLPELAEALLERCRTTYAQAAELMLLEGMLHHYHLRGEEAETSYRRAVELEDSALARLELGRVLLERAQHTDMAARRRKLRDAGVEELRLAIDRDSNRADALTLFCEDAWPEGIEAVQNRLEPVAKAYPESWAVHKVYGDALAAASQPQAAMRAYERALAIHMSDEVLLPYLTLLDREQQHDRLLTAARSIPQLENRDPSLRWKVAQILCEKARHDEARLILQRLVDDERANPVLRQRANEVLDELDEMAKRSEEDSSSDKS